MNKTTIRPEKITMDTLGQMISRLEDRIVTKIDGVETGLGDRIDSLETTMNFRFDGVIRQIDNIHLNYTTLQEHSILKDRVRKIETKVNIKHGE